MNQPKDYAPGVHTVTLQDLKEKNVDELHADYDEYDPTGYYARKAKHREEMLPLLAICFGLCIVIVTGAYLWSLIT